MEIKIGSRVIINTNFTFGRRDRVSQITTNSLGTTLYWMEGGGCFSIGELDLAD